MGGVVTPEVRRYVDSRSSRFLVLRDAPSLVRSAPAASAPATVHRRADSARAASHRHVERDRCLFRPPRWTWFRLGPGGVALELRVQAKQLDLSVE